MNGRAAAPGHPGRGFRQRPGIDRFLLEQRAVAHDHGATVDCAFHAASAIRPEPVRLGEGQAAPLRILDDRGTERVLGRSFQ